MSLNSDKLIKSALTLSSIGPMYDCGATILTFSTMSGTPSSSRTDTNASPIPKLDITSAVSNSELGLNVWAATLTAF